MVGIADGNADNTLYLGQNTGGNGYGYYSSGTTYTDGAGGVSYGASYTTGDVIGVAFDADAGVLTFYNNNISQGAAFTGLTAGPYFFAAGVDTMANSFSNFGQKPFKFPPPEGFLPLNAANARPTTVIARPDQYVGVTTYVGNAGTQSIITGFKPDFVWLKNRGSHPSTNNHFLFDSVRGSTKALYSDLTNQEYNYSPSGVSSLNNNGFTINGEFGPNYSGYNYVAWTWKAGGGSGAGGEFWKDDVQYASAAAAGITEGDNALIGASIGTKQGFSIVSFPITTAADGVISTFGHGLTQSPNFVVIKPINATSGGWTVYHSSLSNPLNNWMRLDTTAAAGDGTLTFSNSNTVFGIRETRPVALGLSANLIAYCWHDVPGLQKFGSYIGNNSADGPFVELGFRPALIILKRYSTGGGNWFLIDSTRDSYNYAHKFLLPNSSNAEETTNDYSTELCDIVSNGFKIRGDASQYSGGSNFNISGATYIYAAFAEAPEFNLYGAQSNAR